MPLVPELRPYQIEALRQITEQRRLIYADPVGSGKTATSLAALGSMNSGRALILAPTYLLDQWVREGERWSPDIEMILGAGSATKRSRARGKLREASGPAALVLNYESAWRDAEELMALGLDTLICDESHRLKNRQTSTFKGIAKIARRLPNLLLVTGTPILNRADEMWASLHLLAPIAYSSFHRWSAEHFDIEVTDFHGKVSRPVRLVKGIKEGHAELIRAEVGDRLLQRDEAEIGLQLPDLVENTVIVQLTAPERKAYDELERRAWTRIEGELVQTVNEVAKITRQRQLAAEWGQLTTEETTPGAKVTATVALAEDLLEEGEHVLIVAQHHATCVRIATALGKRATFLHGGLLPEVQKIRLEAFKDGTVEVLCATFGMVGEGVDGLQGAARHLILVDRDWTPGRNQQVIGRLRRSGQEASTVYAHHVWAEGTLDTRVDAVLESKSSEINAVTGRA